MLRLAIACVIALAAPARADAPKDPARAFDFEHGTWKTQLRLLEKPLSGATRWLEYTGTSTVKPVMGGRANLVELDVSGSAGAIQGISLRLYDPRAKQWSLNFANLRTGSFSTPMFGGFTGARGEFYGLDTVDGRTVIARFIISDVTATSCKFEQAFSADGGKTWETNWIAIDTRTK